MNTQRRSAFRSLLLGVVCAAFFAPAAAQEAHLKAASFLPLNANFGAQFKRWVDEVNRRGKGTLQITAVGPEAVPTTEQANAIKTGVVEMAFLAATYYAGTMWEGEVLPLSERPMKELRANGAWEYLDKLHREKMNSVLLGQIGDGVKMFIYTTKPAGAGAERPMQGLTLRSVPIYKPFFEELGARTVTMPPGDVYTALERNMVHGYGWPKWGVKDMGWLDVTKFRYGPGFLGANTPILVNLDAWNKLSASQRKLLTDMALWLDEEWVKWRTERDAEEERIQSTAGVKYIDMGPAFTQRAHQVRWAELEKHSPQHIPHLRKLMTN
jgi:TRAP-type C4-dicarboxylate transport system substrate-binding protein